MIGTTLSIAGLDKKQEPYPLLLQLLLDIAEPNALPYNIQKIDIGVFIAGVGMEDKCLISLYQRGYGRLLEERWIDSVA